MSAIDNDTQSTNIFSVSSVFVGGVMTASWAIPVGPMKLSQRLKGGSYRANQGGGGAPKGFRSHRGIGGSP